LDEEIDLISNIFYDIDFDQDFDAISLNGQPITTMSIASIIDVLKGKTTTGFIFENCYTDLLKDDPNNYIESSNRQEYKDFVKHGKCFEDLHDLLDMWEIFSCRYE